MTNLTWILFAAGGVVLLILIVAIVRFRLARIDMTFWEFFRRMIVGGGYKNLSAQEYDLLLESADPKPTVIDLRDSKAVKHTPFPGSVSSPFDKFLKEVVVDRKHEPDQPIVLACDNGHLSRVAANILVEDEEFTRVYNLSGGIKKWSRWQESKNQCHGQFLEGLNWCCRNPNSMRKN